MKSRRQSFETIKGNSNFCIYCGNHLQEWEKIADHFIPFASGGSNGNYNLFVSCRECNSIKSDIYFETIEDAREYILPIKRNKGVIKTCIDCGEKISLGRKCNECKITKHIVGKIIYNKECPICLGNFQTTSKIKKYCKHECRDSKFTIECGGCGEDFKSPTNNIKYCSKECKIR